MKRVLVLGGTGFVGRALCRRLSASAGWRITVPTRRRARAQALAVLPNVHVEQIDVHDEAQLARTLAGHDAVVNLVAILHGTPAAFARAHVELAHTLVRACTAAGTRRLVHVSALGADASAPSQYLRSKAVGERVLRESALQVTVLRPSVIFGAEDRFLNTFAQLQRFAPLVPLACSAAQFQPVWVGDVVRAIATCLERPQTIGRVYECAGPDVLTLRELVEFAGRRAGVARRVVGLPLPLAKLQAWLLEHMPGEPLMSRDNLLSMQVPNVATGAFGSLRDLGIAARGVRGSVRLAAE